MRTTASFDLFPDAPSERAIARARWLAREGRATDAEQAYRTVIAENPEIKASWAECFELLRRENRHDDALRLAEAALEQFGASAFPFTLQGAALIELGRYRDALGALERALERDPDLALAWHELGYAAYRLGDPNRALLALDRAFGLEPHTETLRLRGRILREAGRYQAAEVAFEGAAQATEQQDIQDEAEREIRATRRFALYAPRRPDDLSASERWFAETGAVLLASRPHPTPPSDESLVDAFLDLAMDSGWRFGQVVAVGAARPLGAMLAGRWNAPVVDVGGVDAGACPLLLAARLDPGDRAWALAAAWGLEGSGLVFVLEHPGDSHATLGADVVGVLTDAGLRRSLAPDIPHAVTQAQHPAARLAGRRLRVASGTPPRAA